MAAIDRLHTKWYCDRTDLIIWCIKHKPSLLGNIYQVFDLSSTEWNEWQRSVSKNTDYGDDAALPIANFTLKEDRYLYWHCPLDFVRDYLHKQCGYKDNWFVKLFWRN